ncbi:M9 family metallopeptidase [Sphaerisporangium fuscum]|uniref:M9 family metallopeptidase n=1 Tax=Sphaerisporangium fuscum TaxID=2835868 RepID=UPI0027E22A7E|nr:collagenase [Sphaerisporangium fuscum]
MRKPLYGRWLVTLSAALALLFPLFAAPASAAGTPPRPAPAKNGTPPPSPLTATAKDGTPHVRRSPLDVKDRAPLPSSRDALRRDYDRPADTAEHPRPSAKARTPAAACNVADFTGRSGSALVQQITSSTTDCVNTLFDLTGGDAYGAFREAKMTTVAYALRDNGLRYAGDNSAGTAQLVLYLRAGYYVQWYHPADVGTYGSSLATAIQAALDAFFANPASSTVSDANGEILAEAVTLIDSSQQNARYLYVVKRLLNGYNSSYDASWWMLNAVNNVYTVLFRGHQLPAFVTAVQADRGVLDTLDAFAAGHLALLGTDRAYLASNAGRELGRFLQHAALQPTVRPLARHLLGLSSIKGVTAPLWVGVAEMTDSYDKANCSYYGTCDLRNRLAVEVLPITYTCGSSIRIRAQDMTSAQLSASCSSLTNQDAYFHNLVKDGGRPVAGDGNTTIEVVVFDSSGDYQTYAGVMFGIDTDNGGMYLEGDPTAAGNQPRFIAYEAEWLRPDFQIWNLNHEYTHYLDGRFDMYGDFDAGIGTPTVWWIEGFAEYVSYSYRKVTYDAAITEAAKRTYALSTLWDTTYSHDTTRIYRWGYLAVRYMFERHPDDVTTVLGSYRTGAWNTARSFLTGTIGARYDSDWYSWLASCAAGSCSGGGGGGGGTECTGTDTRRLDRNCRRGGLSATTGNYAYLYIYLPAGTSRLTITAAGGTGNADLYYNSASWATTSAYSQRSTASGNTESLVIDNPPAGYNYISLYAAQAFTGAAVTTEY